MLDSKQIEVVRETVRSVLAQCNASTEPAPYDYSLHQECIDDAVKRGYPMDGDHSVTTFLRVGVVFAVTACGHLDRSAQIWVAHYLSLICYVDDVTSRFPSEIPKVYQFNDRFIAGKQQGSDILDAYADIIRRTTEAYGAIPSQLIITSTLNFITANLIEYESMAMKISSMAQQYPIYYRERTSVGEAFAYLAFSRETPWTGYIQAIPVMMRFVAELNDVLSFYKEELLGEDDNHQIAVIARANEQSHMDAFKAMADIVVDHYKKISVILEGSGSSKACEEFKRYGAGFIDFHVSSERYKLTELNL